MNEILDLGTSDKPPQVTVEVLSQWEMWAVLPVLDLFRTPTKVSGGLGSSEHIAKALIGLGR